jgi:hypothetical protein
LHAFEAKTADELTLTEGDVLVDVEAHKGGWSTAMSEASGLYGMCPSNYMAAQPIGEEEGGVEGGVAADQSEEARAQTIAEVAAANAAKKVAVEAAEVAKRREARRAAEAATALAVEAEAATALAVEAETARAAEAMNVLASEAVAKRAAEAANARAAEVAVRRAAEATIARAVETKAKRAAEAKAAAAVEVARHDRIAIDLKVTPVPISSGHFGVVGALFKLDDALAASSASSTADNIGNLCQLVPASRLAAAAATALSLELAIPHVSASAVLTLFFGPPPFGTARNESAGKLGSKREIGSGSNTHAWAVVPQTRRSASPEMEFSERPGALARGSSSASSCASPSFTPFSSSSGKAAIGTSANENICLAKRDVDVGKMGIEVDVGKRTIEVDVGKRTIEVDAGKRTMEARGTKVAVAVAECYDTNLAIVGAESGEVAVESGEGTSTVSTIQDVLTATGQINSSPRHPMATDTAAMTQALGNIHWALAQMQSEMGRRLVKIEEAVLQ